jgi:hypothetical protein
MKNLAFLFAIAMMFLVTACGSDSNSNTDNAGTAGEPSGASVSGMENSAPTVTPVIPTDPAPATAPATASTGGLQHYVCPKGCKGGGGAAQGNCPVCGTAMTHNQAFHAQDPKNTTTPSPTQMPTPPPATTPEPAQNAAGVWHYTCGKGCAGGAGSAGNCAKCGGSLAHNAAYHNK